MSMCLKDRRLRQGDKLFRKKRRMKIKKTKHTEKPTKTLVFLAVTRPVGIAVLESIPVREEHFSEPKTRGIFRLKAIIPVYILKKLTPRHIPGKCLKYTNMLSISTKAGGKQKLTKR